MLNHVLRYQPVTEAIAASGARTVLDVGSGSRGVVPHLLRRASVTACDVSFDDYGSERTGDATGIERVTGSVLDLPFADGAFDAVVSLDLLEHLAPSDRPRALAELSRVAGQLLVVGCPTGAPALDSDRQVARFYERMGRPAPGWLAEHLVNGFPEPDELERGLERAGAVRTQVNSSLRASRLVSCAEALPGLWRLPYWLGEVLRQGLRRPRSHPVAVGVAWALRGGDRGRGYRTIATLRPTR